MDTYFPAPSLSLFSENLKKRVEWRLDAMGRSKAKGDGSSLASVKWLNAPTQNQLIQVQLLVPRLPAGVTLGDAANFSVL